MSREDVMTAQIKVCNARNRAKQLGDDARRDLMIYLASKQRWLESVDKIAVFERDLHEKIAIDVAFQTREMRKARGLSPDIDDDKA